MIRSRMQVLPPGAPCYPSSSWLLGEKRKVWREIDNWTPEENKRFEDALARFDKETPERWVQVASFIPGKTPWEVESHYLHLLDDVRQIEAGQIPSPGYDRSFTLDWETNCGFEGLKQAYCLGRKRSGARAFDQERKKGVPWTEEEHKLFLLGLQRFGKGDWRSISRNYVITKTPTQVASHAQKYFNRLTSGGRDKRRSSIHDITTDNLDSRPPSPSQPAITTQPSSSSASLWSTHHTNSGRSISRNYVITKTPTQVASHAQKYFNRLTSGGRYKRKSSIHDITTDNLDSRLPSLSQPATHHTTQPSSASASLWSSPHKSIADSDKPNEATAVLSQSVQQRYPYGLKLEAHPPLSDTHHGLDQSHNLLF